MKMNTDREWLRKRAEQEDKYIIAVGGLTARLEDEEIKTQQPELTRTAFIQLLRLARREKRLTIQQFAANANVDLRDLVLIENNPNHVPTPRTIHKLAGFINVPSERLMALAGLVKLKDAEFEDAALKFAANSESVEELSKEEQKTLRAYVKFLAER